MRHQRGTIHMRVGVDRGADMAVPQHLLREGDTGVLDQSGRHCVPEHVRGHLHSDLAGRLPKPRLERGIRQRPAPATSATHPRRIGGRVATLLGQAAVERHPELLGHRHPMLIPGALSRTMIVEVRRSKSASVIPSTMPAMLALIPIRAPVRTTAATTGPPRPCRVDQPPHDSRINITRQLRGSRRRSSARRAPEHHHHPAIAPSAQALAPAGPG